MPSRLGKYELLTALAVGGMARIYIARTTGIGSFERHVVLKLITPERANDPLTVQMFLDEARLVASLNHQNVAQVFEVGEDNGIHYLAMEYVHGQDLRALLAKAGNLGMRIPLELSLTTVAGVAAGLHHAHERRGPDGTPLEIVHRDVSPSNIMVGYDGAVKLLDFGIAKAAARSVETQSGIIKGKFAYMSPEQCRGRDVDRRSDVFSLGIMLYEISTQHRCFRADSDFDTMHRIVTGDVVRPSRLVQNYPPALESIVMRALSIDAAQRYPSAGHFLEALETFAMAARMSLSTMALGRFMRDLFGEVTEPWLGAATPAPVAAKESTISSTAESRATQLLPPDGRERGSQPAITRASVRQSQPLPQLEQPAPAQPIVESRSDVGPPVHGLPPSENQADWRGFQPAHDSIQPTQRLSAVQLPEALSGIAAGHGFADHAPNSTGPMMPQHAAPGSGSGPALRPSLPHVAPSTRHGYAGGAGSTLNGGGPSATSPTTGSDVSYPRYDGSTGHGRGHGDEMPTHASRRVLFAGAGLLAVGLFVVIAIVVGGSGKDKDDGMKSGSDVATAPVTTPPATPADDFVLVHVVSDPPGADVLIVGSRMGQTPFDGKVRRGSSTVPLVVHAPGYADFTATIDLASGYSNDGVKLTKLPTIPDPNPNPNGAGSGAVPAAGSDAKTDHPHHPRPPRGSHGQPLPANGDAHAAPQVPSKPKCQPPGQQNPFDTSCNGKPCPVCDE